MAASFNDGSESYEEIFPKCHAKWQGLFQDTASQLEGFTETRFKLGFDKVPYCAGPIPGFNYKEIATLQTFRLIYPWFKQQPFAPVIRNGDSNKATYISAKTLPYEGFSGTFCWSLTSEDQSAKNFVDVNAVGNFALKTFAPWKKTISVSLTEADLDVYRLKDKRDIHRLVFSNIVTRQPNTPQDEEFITEMLSNSFHPRIKRGKKVLQYGESLGLNVNVEYEGRSDFMTTSVYVPNSNGDWIPVFTRALLPHTLIKGVCSLDPWLESANKYSSTIGINHAFIVGSSSGDKNQVAVSIEKRFGFKIDTAARPVDAMLLLTNGEEENRGEKRKREDDDEGVQEMPHARAPKLLTQG